MAKKAVDRKLEAEMRSYKNQALGIAWLMGGLILWDHWADVQVWMFQNAVGVLGGVLLLVVPPILYALAWPFRYAARQSRAAMERRVEEQHVQQAILRELQRLNAKLDGRLVNEEVD